MFRLGYVSRAEVKQALLEGSSVKVQKGDIGSPNCAYIFPPNQEMPEAKALMVELDGMVESGELKKSCDWGCISYSLKEDDNA